MKIPKFFLLLLRQSGLAWSSLYNLQLPSNSLQYSYLSLSSAGMTGINHYNEYFILRL